MRIGDGKSPLYGCNETELRGIVQGLHLPEYRAAQILTWLYQKNVLRWEEISNLPKETLSLLAEKHLLTALESIPDPEAARGESIKFLFQTRDGHLLESVLISQRGRETVCVSTQLGCKIKCSFCASGQGKFCRNLEAGEILEQVVWIARKTQKKITNVVFMGMGEPLDNFDAVLKAIKILIAPWGFSMSARRITVSTSGIAPKILEFVKRMDGRVRLSVSLHSSQEETRNKLVPINQRYSIRELVKTLGRIHRDLKREITFEYTLIDQVNDSKAEAEGVAKIAKPLKAKINIIPYNPVRGCDYQPPSSEKIRKFQTVLEKKGLKVTVRQTAGREIGAACGQLRLDRERSASDQ